MDIFETSILFARIIKAIISTHKYLSTHLLPQIYSYEVTDRPPSQSPQTIYSFHTLGLQEKSRMSTGAPPHCYTL